MRFSTFLASNLINRSVKELDQSVHIGRPSLIHTNPRLVAAMQKARSLHGMTNQSIATVCGVSIGTVMKYTKFIPNSRRHNKFRKVNMRTGEVI